MQATSGAKVQAVTNTTQTPARPKAKREADLRIQLLRRNLARLASASIRDETLRQHIFKRIVEGGSLTDALQSVQIAPDLRAIGDELQ